MHLNPAPASGALLSPASLSSGDMYTNKDELLGVQPELKLSADYVIWNFI